MDNLEIIKGGDIFKSKCDMLVCPTNLVGVMGAGLAKTFKDLFGKRLNDFYKSCLVTMKLEKGVKDYTKVHYNIYKQDKDYSVCLFPTKWDWREKSDIELIKRGLAKILHHVSPEGKKLGCTGVTSIAFPKIGCGLGGLNWENEVKPLLLDFASKYKYYVEVYE